MDTNHAPYALGPEDGEAFWGLDNSLLTFKAAAGQTGGEFSLVEEAAPKGEGTPLHVHREDDESFYILEGELTFYLSEGGEPTPALACSFIHIPGGAAHAFRVDSETGFRNRTLSHHYHPPARTLLPGHKRTGVNKNPSAGETARHGEGRDCVPGVRGRDTRSTARCWCLRKEKRCTHCV